LITRDDPAVIDMKYLSIIVIFITTCIQCHH